MYLALIRLRMAFIKNGAFHYYRQSFISRMALTRRHRVSRIPTPPPDLGILTGCALLEPTWD
jgi:hypothetical protein